MSSVIENNRIIPAMDKLDNQLTFCHWRQPPVVSLIFLMGCQVTFWSKKKTSSAGSATLEDTSWGRLYLTSWNLPDSQLRIQDRAMCGKGWGHRTENRYTGRGGHRTYLIEVGTLHIPYWGGDTALSLLGWGHRTTLKESKSKYQIPSL